MTNDTVADVLTRIRNGQKALHKSVIMPVSKMTKNLLDILQEEGFIENYELSDGASKVLKNRKFSVFLKYYESGLPVITIAKRMSKPGRRHYVQHDELPKVLNGLGIAVVSTSSGLMSDKEARKRKIGGELVALVG